MTEDNKQLLSYGEEGLWTSYYKLTNNGIENILPIVEEAAALKELLQQKGCSKAVIIESTFPGIWALGHLFIDDLSTWNNTEAIARVKKFIICTEKLLQEELEPDIRAKLLMMKSILYRALNEKNKSDECYEEYSIICRQHKYVADKLVRILLVEESKINVPAANRRNMADLYKNISGLAGLSKDQSEIIIRNEIRRLAQDNGYKDALDSVYKRLMEQGTEIS